MHKLRFIKSQIMAIFRQNENALQLRSCAGNTAQAQPSSINGDPNTAAWMLR